ncbi:MAG: hypothetical protein WBD20_23180 [Pirellulaceae bacterium]
MVDEASQSIKYLKVDERIAGIIKGSRSVGTETLSNLAPLGGNIAFPAFVSSSKIQFRVEYLST